MRIDEFGAVFLSADEMFNSIYSGKIKHFKNIYLDSATVEQFNNSKDINRDNIESLDTYKPIEASVDQFDRKNQQDWFMPEYYKEFNIVEFLLDSCKTDDQYNRVITELELFVQHDMIDLLKYLKYLVDTMREHDIVWGVGRGSSVASYCLYLLGVHKIDSMKYELDIKEFLK